LRFFLRDLRLRFGATGSARRCASSYEIEREFSETFPAVDARVTKFCQV